MNRHQRRAEGVSARPSRHAHKLIAETARAMAMELYDEMMSLNNDFYRQWKELNPDMNATQLAERWVTRNIGLMLPQARAALAVMLRTSVDEELKKTIADALILDNTLLRGRKPTRVASSEF